VTQHATDQVTAAFDAVILAGGRASRLGGIDKAALRVHGRSLLDIAVFAVRGARSVVVVGPDRNRAVFVEPTRSRVRFVREDPPFGGPAAALAAGLESLGGNTATSVLVLAADQPNAPAAVARLLAAESGADGVLAVDEDGRRQYLLGRYRTEALREHVAARLADGSLSGSSLRGLVEGLDLGQVVLGNDLCSDVDTEEDAERFGIRLPPRRPEGHGSRMTGHPPELDDWAKRLIDALGIELQQVDIDLILDVARDSAHAITRPAAPVTTFLVGYAAAGAGGGPEQIERASRIAQQLAGEQPAASGDPVP
jgi:molybdopterin-guanine dinucleotide biosynthesis protein A